MPNPKMDKPIISNKIEPAIANSYFLKYKPNSNKNKDIRFNIINKIHIINIY